MTVFLKNPLIIILLMLSAWNAAAQSDSGGELFSFDNLAVAIPVAELGLAFTARVVAANPNEWGVFYALFGIPYAIALAHDEGSETVDWIVPLSIAAYAAYLIELDEDQKSESEIYEENFRGFNIVLAMALAVHLISDNEESDLPGSARAGASRTALGILPLQDGGQFTLMYKF